MSDQKNNSLIAKGLHKKYGSRMVVNNVDISVNRNEVVGLLGPNGAGKTTTFYMITGMIKPTKGDIFLDDKKITLDPMYKRARKGVGYLAQEPSIFSKLTVENNLKLVLEMRKDLSSQEQKEKLDSLLNDSEQKIGFVFYLNVNKETIVKRLEKRKFIEKRTDDDLDTILKRYDTYMETTKPVLDFYLKKNNFHEIDGSKNITEITRKIEAFVNV